MDNQSKHDELSGVYNRRRFIQMMSTVTTGSVLLAACGGSDNQPLTKTTHVNTLSQKDARATLDASVGKTYFPSDDPNVLDAYTAPPPLIQSVQYVPGHGGKVTAFTISFHPAPTPYGQNKYWRELNKRLNVDWQVMLGPSDTYPEKATALLASGDVPDIFYVGLDGAPALITPVKQGAFTDLTPYLSESARKQFPNLAKIGPDAWKNSSRFGKIFGVPRPRSTAGEVLCIRRDWMQKVGITDPKNLDEFFKMAQEIQKAKPDGQQTWAFGSISPTRDFFYQMYRLPNKWGMQNGKLTYYIEMPQFKDAIATVKRFWDAGLFHPDSFTATQAQNKSDHASGKFAAYVDGFTALSGQRANAKKINPKADVVILPPFGYDGGAAVHWKGGGYYGVASIPIQKGGDSGRVKELLRILDYLCAPTFSVEGQFLALGIDGWDNEKGPNGLKKVSDRGQNEIQDMAYIANAPQVLYYPDEPPLGPALQNTQRQLLKMGIDDPTTNLVSETARLQSAKLSQIDSDHFLRIIKGDEPVSAGVDQWIKDRQQSGGDKVRQEFTQQL
ncbi:extracellular solute-binding protein [Dictyobacter formicarum]|uniref:Sugar ABC transporter substrate-binding protein n=1 Tax=Dictyobacter formicarum TaxID=2778368 RepID=A0ABQ3VD25_9CHLR|nr:extracellular solute-binding protein [Dictyobacter formicarum]GHO84047.1 sugar ABC transporter substrate-binding protein [Dictyobacter formicarum]